MIQTQVGEQIAEEDLFDAEVAMQAAQNGDISAFGNIYCHLAPKIHGHLMHLTRGNETLSEEFTQDTFLRAFNSMNSYTAGSVTGWLYQIATNRYLDHHRRKQRIQMDVMETVPDNPSRERLVEDIVTSRLEFERLIENLPPERKAAVFAVYGWNFSNVEAAELLGVPTGTIGSRLLRSRRQIALVVKKPN